MRVRKYKNGNISVTFEPDYDKRETPRNEISPTEEFAVILCNSTELDFTTDGELHMEGMYLYNYNTCGLYLINRDMAQAFFIGKTVKLYWRETQDKFCA